MENVKKPTCFKNCMFYNLILLDDLNQCYFAPTFLFKPGTIVENNCMSFSISATYTGVSKYKILFWVDHTTAE